jgi:redox-sensitive bicupin YhaK (pirin superfamily)
MSVSFVLRAGERGYSRLVSTGPNASYVSGHPDGVITRHSSFNFHEYQSGIAGFGCIRVFGDEVFSPGGTGYNMHPHHNFIISAFVLGGALTHVNTIGKVDELRAGDFYVFSAGSGGKHAELNIGQEDLRVLYLWTLPGQLLAPPSYRRGRFDAKADANRPVCLIGNEAGALPIGQSLKVSRLVTARNGTPVYRPSPARGVYVFVIEGEARIGDTVLGARDSMALTGEDRIEIAARSGSDVLLVETVL